VQGLLLNIEVSEDTQYRTLLSGLEVSFVLTDLGVTNYKRVLAALFVHINMVKRVLSEAKNF
jgi:secreted Zn-dependent insulinase-like peptidase